MPDQRSKSVRSGNETVGKMSFWELLIGDIPLERFWSGNCTVGLRSITPANKKVSEQISTKKKEGNEYKCGNCFAFICKTGTKYEGLDCSEKNITLIFCLVT